MNDEYLFENFEASPLLNGSDKLQSTIKNHLLQPCNLKPATSAKQKIFTVQADKTASAANPVSVIRDPRSDASGFALTIGNY